MPDHPAVVLAAFLIASSPVISMGAAPETAPRERAVAALEQDVKTDPNNAELWLHLGFAYRKLGKIDDAQKAFEKSSTLNPRATDAFFMLGLIYESKHQTADAEKAWKAYLASETDGTKREMAEKHLHHLKE